MGVWNLAAIEFIAASFCQAFVKPNSLAAQAFQASFPPITSQERDRRVGVLAMGEYPQTGGTRLFPGADTDTA